MSMQNPGGSIAKHLQIVVEKILYLSTFSANHNEDFSWFIALLFQHIPIHFNTSSHLG
jgi:hypothetical protein